jgi:hypothetical protein
MKCRWAAWIILVNAATLCGETSANKNTQSPAKLDNWQRSKECAAQAEKLMAEWHRPSEDRPGKSGIAPFWENHYSPKYNRCFIKYTHKIEVKDRTGVFEDLLYDAFERSTLATSLYPFVPPEVKFFCSTDDDSHADCEKAKNLHLRPYEKLTALRGYTDLAEKSRRSI